MGQALYPLVGNAPILPNTAQQLLYGTYGLYSNPGAFSAFNSYCNASNSAMLSTLWGVTVPQCK